MSLNLTKCCFFVRPVQKRRRASLVTFCPRNRLLAERMVKPSPGPSSTVELGSDSFSDSVLFKQTQTDFTLTQTDPDSHLISLIGELLWDPPVPWAFVPVGPSLSWSLWVSWSCVWARPVSQSAAPPPSPGRLSSSTEARDESGAGLHRSIWSLLEEAEGHTV